MCPKCSEEKTYVVKTIKELKVLRWRKCSACGYSWLTEEKPVRDKEIVEYVDYIESFERKK